PRTAFSGHHATRDGGGARWRLASPAVATDFRSDGTPASSDDRELPVVDLIGRGLIERCYGAPYDPAGIVATEIALEHTPDVVIDLRHPPLPTAQTRLAPAHLAPAPLSPRELRARWRVFRSYWLGHLCSMIGDHITLVALPLAAERPTGSGQGRG